MLTTSLFFVCDMFRPLVEGTHYIRSPSPCRISKTWQATQSSNLAECPGAPGFGALTNWSNHGGRFGGRCKRQTVTAFGHFSCTACSSRRSDLLRGDNSHQNKAQGPGIQVPVEKVGRFKSAHPKNVGVTARDSEMVKRHCPESHTHNHTHAQYYSILKSIENLS